MTKKNKIGVLIIPILCASLCVTLNLKELGNKSSSSMDNSNKVAISSQIEEIAISKEVPLISKQSGTAVTNTKTRESKVPSNNKTQKKIKLYTKTCVNFRKKPSINSKVIKTLSRNTSVIKIKTVGKWTKVKKGNTYGYISSKYLSTKKMSNRWNISLSESDIGLITKIVYLEADNQGLYGQEAVVEVILNRLHSGIWGDTVYDVLSSPGQFVTWKNRNLAKVNKTNRKAVRNVLNGKTDILTNKYMYFSMGGHASHSDMIQIKEHQFCTKG